MKVKVILENSEYQYYTLSSRLKFNLELFKRLEEAGYDWEFVNNGN